MLDGNICTVLDLQLQQPCRGAHQGEVHCGELLLVVRCPAALVAGVAANVFSAQLQHKVVSLHNLQAKCGTGASIAVGSPPVQQTGGSQWHRLLHVPPASPAAARLLQESLAELHHQSSDQRPVHAMNRKAASREICSLS